MSDEDADDDMPFLVVLLDTPFVVNDDVFGSLRGLLRDLNYDYCHAEEEVLVRYQGKVRRMTEINYSIVGAEPDKLRLVNILSGSAALMSIPVIVIERRIYNDAGMICVWRWPETANIMELPDQEEGSVRTPACFE